MTTHTKTMHTKTTQTKKTHSKKINQKHTKNTLMLWLAVGFICFVFVQSLFFKFTDSIETQLIFGTIADWMTTIPWLNAVAEPFANYGGYSVGGAELVASLLLLFRKTRLFGAVLGLLVMTGALFFHVFTPLGISIVEDLDGNTDGGALFAMACLVWLACAYVLYVTSKRT